MMKKMFFLLLSMMSMSASLTHASLFLYNDSSFPLTAVIIAASGATLGEVTIAPQATSYFEDALGGSNPTATQPYTAEPGTNQFPLAPYTVIWNCMNGSNYATCTMVSSGGLSSPNMCEGSKYCQPPKQQNQNNELQVPSSE